MKLIFLIFIVVIIFSCIIFVKYQRYKKDLAEEKRFQSIDLLTTKPAQINIKIIEPIINDIIESYLKAIYFLNPIYLPKNMMQEFYSKTYKEMEREYNLGVRKELIKYEPLKKYKIRQNNSSIYSVGELNVECEYKIEFHSFHSTFNKIERKTVRQIISFLNCNNGWYLNAIKSEQIISQEEIAC